MGDDKMTEYLDHGDLACRALQNAVDLCMRPDVQGGDLDAIIFSIDIALDHLRAMEAARMLRIHEHDPRR